MEDSNAWSTCARNCKEWEVRVTIKRSDIRTFSRLNLRRHPPCFYCDSKTHLLHECADRQSDDKQQKMEEQNTGTEQTTSTEQT